MLPRNTMYEEIPGRREGLPDIFSWPCVVSVQCLSCDMVNKRKVGGRPKRKQNIAGCPKVITEHVHTVSGTKYKCSIPLTTTVFTTYICSLDEFVCYILDEPVELPCKQMICCSCCLPSTDHFLLWKASDPKIHESADDTL